MRDAHQLKEALRAAVTASAQETVEAIATEMKQRDINLSWQDFSTGYNDFSNNLNSPIIAPLFAVSEPVVYENMLLNTIGNRNTDAMKHVLGHFKAHMLPTYPEASLSVIQKALRNALQDNRREEAEYIVDFMLDNRLSPGNNMLWDGTARSNGREMALPVFSVGQDMLMRKLAVLNLEHRTSLIPPGEENGEVKKGKDTFMLAVAMKNLSVETVEMLTIAHFLNDAKSGVFPDDCPPEHQAIINNVTMAASVIKGPVNPMGDATKLESIAARFPTIRFKSEMLAWVGREHTDELARMVVKHAPEQPLYQPERSWERFISNEYTPELIDGLLKGFRKIVPTESVSRKPLPSGPIDIILEYLGVAPRAYKVEKILSQPSTVRTTPPSQVQRVQENVTVNPNASLEKK